MKCKYFANKSYSRNSVHVKFQQHRLWRFTQSVIFPHVHHGDWWEVVRHRAPVYPGPERERGPCVLSDSLLHFQNRGSSKYGYVKQYDL